MAKTKKLVSPEPSRKRKKEDRGANATDDIQVTVKKPVGGHNQSLQVQNQGNVISSVQTSAFKVASSFLPLPQQIQSVSGPTLQVYNPPSTNNVYTGYWPQFIGTSVIPPPPPPPPGCSYVTTSSSRQASHTPGYSVNLAGSSTASWGSVPFNVYNLQYPGYPGSGYNQPGNGNHSGYYAPTSIQVNSSYPIQSGASSSGCQLQQSSAVSFPPKQQEPSGQKTDHVNERLVAFIKKQMLDIETELECPVCLLPSQAPIYTCTLQHHICSKCWEDMKAKKPLCPVCREVLSDPPARHRLMEKLAEQLKQSSDELQKLLPH